MNTNKNIHIRGDRKFNELSEYVLNFVEVRCYDNNNRKIQSATYFFQGDISKEINLQIQDSL